MKSKTIVTKRTKKTVDTTQSPIACSNKRMLQSILKGQKEIRLKLGELEALTRRIQVKTDDVANIIVISPMKRKKYTFEEAIYVGVFCALQYKM